MDNRRWWDVRSRLMRAAQRCRTQKGCARTILAFEALEPRILLSADPFGTAPAAGLGEALPSAAIIAPLHERAGEPARIAWTPPVQPNGVQSALPDPTQVVYLDFDGANDIVYRGPVFIQDIDVPAFQANGALRGHEDEVAAGVRDLLEKAFAGTQIDFTLEQPAADSPCSTVFIGGDGAAFAAYGSFYGISERVDEGNRDRSDNAFMFPAALPITACSVSQYAGELAYYIGHEVGHLLGLEHEHAIGEHSDEAAGALSAVAFAPYTHVETALDIRNDVIDDGQVTIAGKQYQVNPLIVEAVSRYPAFYYGGAVGPDGFPDIVQGQSIVHPDSSGVWVGHVLDKAWAAQGAASRYSQEEQLQILAWGYGYAIHAVGDLWSHTLVNEFADGPFPDFANVVTVDLARANALRHIIVEGYIADATPGFDADSDRSRLPDGDVSDNASFPRTLAAPHAFIADALIADLPDLPGQKEERLFSVAASDANLSAVIAALDANAFPEALKTQFIDHHRQLADTLVVTTVKAGQIWTVRSDFDDFVLRRAGTDAAPVLEVSERSESRGVVIDAFLALRERLVALKAALPAPAPGFQEPFAGVVDSILAAAQKLVRGEQSLDVKMLFDQLRTLAEDVVQPFKPLFKAVAGAQAPTDAALMQLASAFGAAGGSGASAYLGYWIDHIDRGLEHWSELGLAVSRALFDPQAERDLQNREGQSHGPDALDAQFNDRRAEREGDVGLLDVFAHTLEDPNDDGAIGDSFVNRFLLPMLGVPAKLGELRAGLTSVLAELEDKFLRPARELLGDINPLDPLIDWIKDEIREYLHDVVRRLILARFGVDIEIVDFLKHLDGDKLDLKSITIGDAKVPVFASNARERLDAYLGLRGDHLQPFPFTGLTQSFPIGQGLTLTIEFHEGAQGALKPDVEFDKSKFAAYANSVTLGKLSLLQETLVNQAPVGGVQPKTISRLLTDLTGQSYDFGRMTLNGKHGGNILTATMPGAVDSLVGQPVSVFDLYPLPISSDLWFTALDGDHVWREDSQTRIGELYRYHETGVGDNRVRWQFTGLTDGASYAVQTDWLTNNRLTSEGMKSPARMAPYTIDAGNGLHTVFVDQLMLPDDVTVIPSEPGSPEASGQRWKTLGTFTVTGNTLSVTLTDDDRADGIDDPSRGAFVVAGRVRLVPVADPNGARIISRHDAGYSDNAGILFGTPLAPGAAMDLDSRLLPADLRAAFTSAGKPLDARAAVVVITPGLQWLVVDVIKADPDKSERIAFGALYMLRADGSGSVQISQGWRDIKYRTGQGNFPLWESALLRDKAFRVLFTDWENGSADFPDLGDLPTPDPNVGTPPLAFGAFPPFQREAPVLIAPSTGSLVVSGDQALSLPGDRSFTGIVGDGNAIADGLELNVEKDLVIGGFVGGSGLKDIVLRAGESITVLDGSTISSRQVAIGGNHWDAASIGDSGTITLIAPRINVGKGANIIAHADDGHASGDVTLRAAEQIDQLWSFLGIDNFRVSDTRAAINVASDARLTGNVITLDASATTDKRASLDRDFSTPTRAIALGDVDGDQRSDLLVGTAGRGLLLLKNTGNGFGAGTVLDSGAFSTSSLALDDVDGDGDLDLVVGNVGQPSRFYRNLGSTFEAGVEFGPAASTNAVALANLDADAALELVAGTGDRGILLYQFDNGSFGAPSAIDARIAATTALALADVDGDGKIDLVAGNRGSPNRLYLNTGLGFASGTDIDAAMDTSALTLANLDNDARPELIVATSGGGILEYRFAGGRFGASLAIDGASTRTTALATGDIDADGDVDLVAANRGEPNRFYRNASGILGPGQNITSDAHSTTAIAVEAVDATPGLEVIAGNDRTPNRLYRFEVVHGVGGYRFGEDIGVDPQLAGAVQTQEPLPLSTDKAVAVVSAANAAIALGTGSFLAASDDVVLRAAATAHTEITTVRSGWGITYGSSSPSATVRIDQGSVIQAGDDVSVAALGQNDLTVTTFVPATGESTNVSFSLGIAHSTAQVAIRGGAVVEGNDVSVEARNQNAFRNSAIAAGFGAKSGGDSGAGIAVALGFYQSEATASVDGTVDASGDVRVASQSINAVNATRSFGSVSNAISIPAQGGGTGLAGIFGPLFGQVGQFIDAIPLGTKIGGRDDLNMQFRSDPLVSGYAAGIAMVTSDNRAAALLGDGARVFAGRDLQVLAEAEDPFQVSASGSAGALGASKDTSIGGALAYSKAANQASAFIGWNAQADALGTLLVDAQARIESPVAPLALALTVAGLGPQTEAQAIGAVHAYGSGLSDDIRDVLNRELPGYLNDAPDDEGRIGTSFIHAGGSVGSGGTLIGGGINVLYTYNAATSGIAKGARVNQRLPVLPAEQDVIVRSTGTVASVNFAGNASVLNFATSRDSTGIGGFLDWIVSQNFATAAIDDLASVSAGRDILVSADTAHDVTTIVQAGDAAESTAVDGAIGYVKVEDTAWAYAENRANLRAARDLALDAESAVRAIDIAPAIAIGDEIGAGIAAAFTELSGTTRAFMADAAEPVSVGGYGGVLGAAQASRDMRVKANASSALWSVAASAGIAAGSDQGSGPVRQASVEAGEAQVGGTYGFGASGSVAFNWFDQDTQAYIRDAVTIAAGGALALEAASKPLLVAAAGAFAFGNDVGFGGTYAHNEIDQATSAFAENAQLSSATLHIAAQTDAVVVTVAASGSGAKESGGIAGAVPRVILAGETLASIGDAAVVQASDVFVQADQTDQLVTVAGAATIGPDFAVGASVGLTSVDSAVRASIEGAVVHATGSVAVESEHTTEVVALAAALGVATSGIGAGGSGLLNTIGNAVDARVGMQAQIVAGSALRVAARDRSTLFAVAGSGAAAADVAIGAAAAVNEVANEVDARVDQAEAEVGALDIGAIGHTDIAAITVGGAGAQTFAIEGSFARNTIENRAGASITGGARIEAAGDVQLTADDAATISALAGSLAGAGTAAVGLAWGTNVVGSSASALIAQSSVAAGGAVGLSATSAPAIKALTVAGAGAGTVAAGGSVSLNQIGGGAQSTISNGAEVHAARGIDVTAQDHGKVQALAGGVAGAGTAAVGVAVATNEIESAVRAAIEGSQVTAASVALSADSAPAIEALTVGGAGAGTFATGGSVSRNDIHTTSAALIVSGSQVEASGSVRVTASDGASIDALAGGMAGAGAAAIGAAYATNQIGGASAARISASTVRSSGGGLDVSAVSRAQIKALTVGGAGAGAFAAGGSVSRNAIRNTVAAHVGDAATASARGPIAIEALDDAVIESLAGGVSGAGLAAIGVAKAANAIADSTTASIAGSTVESATGDVELNAATEGTIQVIAVGGAGAGAFAAAGSLSENDIANTAAARIVAGSSVDASGNLTLNASDDARIESLAGGVAGAGLAAIGAAQSTNRIASTIETVIDASVARAETMALQATTDADIRVASLGGAGAGIAALAGSDSRNDIRNRIDAHLSGGAQALARGALTVQASDDAAIAALAGGGAGAVVIAVGAARADNEISNTVTAYSEHAIITAQSIHFLSSTTPEIRAIAAGGSGALYFAFGGSIADNRIDNRLDAHVTADSMLTATLGDVRVRAMETDASIRSLSGTVTGAGGLSGGAAFSTNDIGSTLTAYIESARAVATLGSVEVTVGSDASIEALTVGGFGAFLVAGGASISRNAIHNTLDAHISDGAAIQAQGAITIASADTATIASLGGAVVGAGGVAIGGSAGRNEIGGAVTAFIHGANVQSTAGGVLVGARGESTIKSLTVSGVGAALVAGGGSTSRNEITRAVDAHISGGAQVHAQRLVQVSASDAPSIQTFAGAGAGAAGVAVGVSLSENAIGGLVNARIADATVSSEVGNVEVLGTTDTEVETLTVAGAFAAVAVETSREDTEIDPDISVAISDGAVVQAGADIAVRGEARFDVQGNAGGGAIGIAGIGDTKIAVSLDPRTRATVDTNATLAAGHDIEIAASSEIARLEVGVYAGSGGVAAREAAVAEALSTNSATATLSGVDIDRAAAVRVAAETLSDIHANALGAALGAVAIGSTRARAAETGTTIASIDQARIGQSADAEDRVGALGVTARSSNAIAAEETMARGGVGLPNARNVATAQANPSVTSAITGSTIAVQSDASISAQSESSADADSFALDIGVLTVGGSDARAEVNPAVSAGIDDRTILNAGGMVTVEALNNPGGGRARARAQSPGGSLIAVNGADAAAIAAANVDAHVRNADVHAGALLTIRAESLDRSLAVGEGITLGLVAGVGQVTIRAFAGIDEAGSRSAIEADLDHARITAAGLSIEATSADASEVRGSASGGGVLSDQGAASAAHVGPQVRAAIGDDTSVDVEQDVAIAAVALPEADGGASGTTLGLFAVGDSVTQLLVDPVVNSFIGRNTQISAGRDVLIAASSGRAPALPADTFEGASTAAGGDVDLENDTIRLPGHGLSDGDELFYQALGSNVVGGLEQARDYSALRVDDNTLQLGQSFDAAEVDAAQNLVRFTTPHRFADGDVVVYQARGGVPIGGAGSDGRRFKLEVVDDLTIKLQRADAPDRRTFDPAAAGTVDSAANTIAIADHGFRDGDAVTYRAPNDAGFTSAMVDVRVVTAGPDRGKLVQNPGDDSFQDFPDSDNIYVPGSRIDANGQLVGHDFTAGEQVVYQASGPKQVVRFPDAHGLQTGDAVVYRNDGGGSDIGGLQNGATYFVIRVDEHALKLATSALAAAKGAAINLDPAGAAAHHTLSAGTSALGFAPADVDVALIGGLQNGATYFVITSAVKPELSPFEIQLARTLAEALGDPGVPGDPSDDVAVTPIALSPGKDASADRSVAHRLIRPSVPSLGPLEDGATYFVRDATASTFRLAASPGGPALDIEQGAARGQHSLAMAGVDLEATSGIQRLVIDLTGAAPGAHRILGPGGMPLHSSSTSAGDGVSSASASGSSGGFVGLKGAETSVTMKPVVAAFVEDQAIGQASGIHAGRDVTVRSDSNANLAAGSRSSSGGLLASGRSQSSASMDTSSSVAVGDRVTIDAGHDVLLSSSSAHTSRASGSARGGALVDLAESAPAAAVDYETQARVGHRAQIVAGNDLTVQALTSVDASAVSRARGAGLVAHAKAKANLVVGETRATTRTAIESDAVLRADEVALTAAMPKYSVSVDTDSRVRAILFSDSDGASGIAAAGTTELTIGAGAALTGEHGVAIVARIDNLDALAQARARATALAGDTDAVAVNSVPVAARIVAEPGALVTAGPRLEGSTVHDALLVRADVQTDRYVRTAERHPALVDFGERRQAGDLQPARSIVWDADVVIHSGPSPELLVSADGTLVKAVNVTVDGGLGEGGRVSGPFRVDPIVNKIHGTVRFDASESPGTDGVVSGVPGSIAGAQGTLHFQDTLKAITLHNLSPHLMTVDPIATLHDPSFPGAVLPAIVATADSVMLQFDVQHRTPPTAIDIQPSPLAPIAMAASLERPATNRRDQRGI